MDEEEKELVRHWFKQKKKLNEISIEVDNLEKEIVERFFNQNGVDNVTVDENWNLKYNTNVYVGVVPSELERHEQLLRQEGHIGSAKLLEPDYKVNMTAFEHLSKKDQLRFASLFNYKSIETLYLERNES